MPTASKVQPRLFDPFKLARGRGWTSLHDSGRSALVLASLAGALIAATASASGTPKTKADVAREPLTARSGPALTAAECPVPWPFRSSWSGEVNVPIPDNFEPGAYVGAVPVSADGLVIDDVVVDVNMAHTWAGDVAIDLYYDVDNDGFGDIGPVPLMCTPGIVGCAIASCCGCGGDLNGSYRFSDAGEGVLGEVYCTEQLLPGCYQPDPAYGSLQMFDGAPDGGQFLLYAYDYEAQDTGTIFDFTVYTRLGCGHPVINVPGDYPTVQAAVNAACDGDVIRIAPGSYGDVVADFSFNRKALTLEGTNPAFRPTFNLIDIQGLNSGSGLRNLVASSIFFGGDGDIDFTNLQVAGDCEATVGGGWFTMTNCVVGAHLFCAGYKGLVKNCTARWIEFYEQEVAQLEDCVANLVTIHCRDNGGATVRGNTIVGNGASGILLAVSHFNQPVVIDRNLLVGQPDGSDVGVSISFPHSANTSKTCNDVWRCATRYSGTSDPTGAAGNISIDPIFCNAAGGNYTLNSHSPCAPGHHPLGANCGVIGALPVGCPTSGIDDTPLARGLEVSAAPNPARGQVIFSIQGAVGDTRLHIYDASGRAVRTLLVTTTAGQAEVSWDGRDDSGRVAAAGVYFYKLNTRGGEQTKRLIVLR